MRDPQDAVAGQLERAVSHAVTLERLARAVKRVAVELDHYSGAWPERIHLIASDHRVHRRSRQAGGAAELEEAVLELGAGVLSRQMVACEKLHEWAQPTPTRASSGELLNRSNVEDPQPLGLFEDAPELPRPQDLGEVQQRARKRGYRDAVASQAVIGAQPAHAMERDARPTVTTAAGGGHVEGARGTHVKVPQ